MTHKRVLIITPLIFWLLLIAIKFIRLIPMYHGDELSEILVTVLITTSLDMITFSFFYYVILPDILLKKRITSSITLSIIYWLIFGVVWSLVYYLFGRTVDFEESVVIYKASLGHTLLSTIYAIVLRLSVDWFNKYQRQKELEKESVITELALLRSQINPHFLFNTLNNINAFSTNNPEKTSYAIIKLSEIMRYMLYEASNEKVLLDKEIEYIENIIALQKLRYKESNFIKFTVIGETGNIFIPPMIFLPFIENAFKHGTNSIKNGIEVILIVHGKMIDFQCNNMIKELSETESRQEGGVGIRNIVRRLQLLFPHKHELEILNKNNQYIVNLKINLDEY